MITWSGLYGIIASVISLLLLLALPILFFTAKGKRNVILWLMKQTIIWNLISALFVFVSGTMKSGICIRGFFNAHNGISTFLENVVELLPCCNLLILFALTLFIFRFFLLAWMNLQTNTTEQ